VIAAWRRFVASGIEIASASSRIREGRDSSRLAAAGSASGEALSRLAGAVRLIEVRPRLTWRADQQHLLGELNGLPMDAAAVAIEVDPLRGSHRAARTGPGNPAGQAAGDARAHARL